MFYEHAERVPAFCRRYKKYSGNVIRTSCERCITSVLEFLSRATSAKMSEIRTNMGKELEIEIPETTSLKIQRLVKSPSLNS